MPGTYMSDIKGNTMADVCSKCGKKLHYLETLGDDEKPACWSCHLKNDKAKSVGVREAILIGNFDKNANNKTFRRMLSKLPFMP